MSTVKAPELMLMVDDDGNEQYFCLLQRVKWTDGNTYLLLSNADLLSDYQSGVAHNLEVEVVGEREENGETIYTTADDDVADSIVEYLQAYAELASAESNGMLQ